MTTHPRLRAAERYGVTLTEADIRALEQDIADGKSICIDKHAGPHGGEKHMVRFGEVVMAMIVRRMPTIITVLPPESVTKGQLRRGYERARKRDGRKPRW